MKNNNTRILLVLLELQFLTWRWRWCNHCHCHCQYSCCSRGTQGERKLSSCYHWRQIPRKCCCQSRCFHSLRCPLICLWEILDVRDIQPDAVRTKRGYLGKEHITIKHLSKVTDHEQIFCKTWILPTQMSIRHTVTPRNHRVMYRWHMLLMSKVPLTDWHKTVYMVVQDFLLMFIHF